MSNIATKQPADFTKLNSDKILKLEKEIAYFYGAKELELRAGADVANSGSKSILL